MSNQIIFFIHTFLVGATALGALWAGVYALIAFICLQTILANLFVIKSISLCGFTATGADAYIIGAVFGFHLLQEFHGAALARRTIFISFGLLLFYTIMSQLQIAYIPTLGDITHLHFCAILEFMPRIAAASLTSYLVTQYIDWLLFRFFKRALSGRHFTIRNYICASITQLLDTIFFSILGLYGIVENVTQIIIISYIIKMFALFLSTPFMLLAKKIFPTPAKNNGVL